MMDDSDSTAVWILRHTSDAKSSDKVEQQQKQSEQYIDIYLYKFINAVIWDSAALPHYTQIA